MSTAVSIKEKPEVERDFRLRSAFPSDGIARRGKAFCTFDAVLNRWWDPARDCRRAEAFSSVLSIGVLRTSLNDVFFFPSRVSSMDKLRKLIVATEVREPSQAIRVTDTLARKSTERSMIDHQTRTRLRRMFRPRYNPFGGCCVILSDSDVLYIESYLSIYKLM